ncbi:MAG: pyruvate formate lyase family protein, partial [Clostridia bacterium]|nr:pyruvate formate lyase family protein [Clostridia bacterium]
MTAKIETLLKLLKKKEYKNLRKGDKRPDYDDFGKLEGYINNFRAFIENERPIIHENDDFGFNMSINYKPIQVSGNYTPNYYRVISSGFDDVCDKIRESIAKHNDKDKSDFGYAMIECIEIFLTLCDKYRDLAKEQGNLRLYNALCKVPRKPAETFYEACLFLKICIYLMRVAFTDHLGLGRFDQYMYEFYKKDIERGVAREELFETLEEFFISLNKDTDLYAGIQLGDNGQSMVLGGFDKDGNSMYNDLSKLCMEASLELNLIDPKINLRVGKNTPDELYEFGTQLTKKGLGFPQYCNDDVVVP